MVRQLNIRSDEAFETARTLAKHFGRTTTEIVIDALREYRSRRLVPSQRITKEEAKEGNRILKEEAKNSPQVNLLAPLPITATCMTSTACRSDCAEFLRHNFRRTRRTRCRGHIQMPAAMTVCSEHRRCSKRI